MKKGLILLCGLFLLTGCGKKTEESVTCTITSTDEEIESMSISAKLNNDEITSLSTTINYKSEDIANISCGIYGLMKSNKEAKDSIDITCDGKTITISNYDKFADDEKASELEGKSKAEFIETFEKEGYSCK